MNADSKEAADDLAHGELKRSAGRALLPVAEPICLGQECPSYGTAE
jgi:hypothetical protein